MGVHSQWENETNRRVSAVIRSPLNFASNNFIYPEIDLYLLGWSCNEYSLTVSSVQPTTDDYFTRLMASVDQGYEDERFESAVPHNFHCAICLNVLKQPMQCMRNEHSFCKPCITRYLEEFQRCPTCMEPLTLQTLRPSRLLRDLMSPLKIKCDNLARGCPNIVELEKLKDHIAECGFRQVQCTNHGCEMIVNKKDLALHEMKDCNFRKAKCEVCGKNVPCAKRKLHCYVMRTELDKVKEDISSIKDIVMNMSRELTRHVGDMKGQIDNVNLQVTDLSAQMCDMKHKIDKIEKEAKNMKRQLQSSFRSHASPVSYPSQNMNIRNDVIIAGGFNLRSVEMFRWTTKQWTLLQPMTSDRWGPSSFVHRGQMFVCGGGGVKDGSIEVLNLEEEGAQWTKFTIKLPQWSWGHTSVVYENNLLVSGGKSGFNIVNDVYKVSLVPPYSSQLVCHLPEPRTCHGAQCFGDKVVIVGGTTTGGSSDSLDTVLSYDITNNCCKTLAPLPYAVRNMATVAWKDNIIIIGGVDKNGNALNSVVVYNITNENSKMLPPMKHKRSSCTAVIDNLIIVMGGYSEEEGNLNSVEGFNFDNYVWEDLPPMKEKRHLATAVVKCGS